MGINTTLLFFLLLIPLSGLIAFVGDRIGHRMGKRRHSLLGLRPRHTAMVFTIGSGVGISLLTFGLMYGSSETFREVLARGAELKRLNRTLERRNAKLASANADADRRIAALNEEAKRAEEAKAVAEKARTEAVARQGEAEQKTKQAARALRGAEANLSAERGKLNGARQALTGAEAKVREAKARLERASTASQAARAEARAAQKQAQLAQARVQQAERDVTAAGERVARANRTFENVTKFQSEKLSDQRREIARQTTRLFQQESKLAAQSRQLTERSEQLATQNRTAERQRMEVARLTDEVTDLERKRADSQRQLASAISTSKALRDSRIIYRVGEEIDRISIAPTSSVYRVQNRLEALLTTGGKKAETRGAARGGDLERAVLIPTRSNDTQIVTETDVLREVSGAVRKANQDVVVVLLSSENAVIGEPVRADLRILRNPLLFKAGTLLGEVLLPDTRVRQDTADRLYAFLRGEIREKLIRAGAIPPLLGEDAETSLVTLSGDEWLSLLDDARQAGWRARVSVRCARDLRAADPVRLTFDIKGLPATVTDRRPTP
jgi:uncharacterized coiled-coil protein SlyX